MHTVPNLEAPYGEKTLVLVCGVCVATDKYRRGLAFSRMLNCLHMTKLYSFNRH